MDFQGVEHLATSIPFFRPCGVLKYPNLAKELEPIKPASFRPYSKLIKNLIDRLPILNQLRYPQSIILHSLL